MSEVEGVVLESCPVQDQLGSFPTTSRLPQLPALPTDYTFGIPVSPLIYSDLKMGTKNTYFLQF